MGILLRGLLCGGMGSTAGRNLPKLPWVWLNLVQQGGTLFGDGFIAAWHLLGLWVGCSLVWMRMV